MSVRKLKKHSGLLARSVALSITAILASMSDPVYGDAAHRINGVSLEPLDIFQECDVCPEMVVLPMGSFTMGAPLEESALLESIYRKPRPGIPFGLSHEGPPHKVEIDIPVAMGRNEVTRGEWEACVADSGCKVMPDAKMPSRHGGQPVDHPRHPVIRITFEDAQDYVAWINTKVGSNVYRLPTEAEWEYAARAGTQTKFAQGDTLTSEQANFTHFFMVRGRWTTDKQIVTRPVLVDQLDAANAWGLRHMSGNVSELTLGCFSKRHLGLATSSAYLHLASTASPCRRVHKGGGFTSTKERARPGGRRGLSKTVPASAVGIRVLREMR